MFASAPWMGGGVSAAFMRLKIIAHMFNKVRYTDVKCTSSSWDAPHLVSHMSPDACDL